MYRLASLRKSLTALLSAETVELFGGEDAYDEKGSL